MKILFVTSNRIGDAVLSTGVLGHLLEHNPDARVTVACGAAPAPLFADVPGVERVIVMRKARFAGHWRKLWLASVGTWWDLVVDLRASAISWLVPAKRRLMFRPRGLRRGIIPQHRVAELAGMIGLTNAPPWPRLWLGDRAIDQARQLIPAGGPVLGVGPTANWIGKQWPADRFNAAIARLTAADGILPGARVAVFGAPAERDVALKVLAAIPEERRIDLAGSTEIDIAVACLGRCAFYLGNDSGLMHAAAAMGTTTLGVFGPSSEHLYGPWGAHALSVRGPRNFDDIVLVPGYDHTNPPADMMNDLDVDTVVAAAFTRWRKVHGP